MNSSHIVLFTIVLSAFLGGWSHKANAQSPGYLWAKSAGGTGADYGKSVSVDANGNVYVTGYFSSPSITFGATTFTSNSSFDIFVVKYDASGNVLWARNAGGPNDDNSNSICVDASGNAYVTGFFQSPTITFGTTTLTNTDNSGFTANIFIAKYDASGNILWAKSAGAAVQADGRGIGVDASGNVYLTGYFNGPSITFGSITVTTSGSRDIVIVKYDASGNVLWAKKVGGPNVDQSNSISIDSKGNIIITGRFNSPTLTVGSTTLTNTGGSDDFFIAKYDASGNALWAKSAVGTDNDEGNSISTNAQGNVFVTGWFSSTSLTFGSSTLTNTTTNGNRDMFVAKYDSAGTVLWAKSAGGNTEDNGTCIRTDASGASYVSGYFFSTTITFGTTTLTNTTTINYSDMFVVKYDVAGNLLWAKSAGGTSNEYGYALTIDASSKLVLTGAFTSPSVAFGSLTLTRNPNVNSYDLFIVKLDNTTTSLEREGPLCLPGSFSLGQNYPNPFNPSTSFQISIPQHSMAVLKIYDVIGKEVATLVDQELPAGQYSVQWNATNQQSGTYFATLRTGSFTQTRKVTLVK
ncbi:MAG: SBBP repeat-containing protein [bacterium]